MDELQSIGVGLALGLILVSFLNFYPGKPFDYITDSCGTSTTVIEPASSSTAVTAIDTKQEQIAEIEQAAQRVKIHKLQEMLGLEKAKAQELVQRAKKQAMNAVETHSPSSSYTSGNKCVWLDRVFLTTMFGLLAWVLWQDYSINLVSVVAHLLPRETEVVRQIVAASCGLLGQVEIMWG
ncbi:hypothetical protein V7S43_007140 [Phytophthora oleae]|uniref:Uncharacterized protein n=1 Tax=Phytophthora oleae TaxID=2107226 RepID=A0ABD3FPG0_9STRA